MLRVDKKGHRYLFVLNPHTRETREDEVAVVGKYPMCLDMGVGSGTPVPTKFKESQTRFQLRLHPGEGTVIALDR